MPAPERTSTAEIISAARDLLESHGHAGLTMQAVAERVGVRAPSLYKRVRNRDDLVRLVAEATVRDLADRLHAVPPADDPRAGLAALVHAFRAFARERPTGYRLILGSGPETAPVDLALIAHATAPVLRAVTALAGPADALEAARTVTAWANGFITMELSGAFNLGGDVERAFDYGITRLAAALGA